MKVLVSIVFFLLSALAVPAQDQPASLPAQVLPSIPVPQVLNRGLGGSIEPYTDRPPDLILIPHGEGGRKGRVWLQTVGWGLLVVGEVDGKRPDFPGNENLILEKDHVEIWLADGKDPDLPPMGWGNQFQEITLSKDADSCADWAQHGAGDTPAAPESNGAEKRCRTWATTQTEYRPFFKRLFTRQWLVTPDYAVESYATPAYDRITARFASDRPDNQEIPAALQPLSQLRMWPGPGKNRVGYTFEIIIPFTSFPPLSSTELRDLRFLLEVFNPPEPGKKVGVYSTSSSTRAFGKPETFNRLALNPPRQFHLTPCDLPLAAKDKYGGVRAAWFVPKANQAIDFEHDAFIVVNDGNGYQYEPDALSPVARPVHFFWHGIAESEWVCGPHLSYRKGGRLQTFDAEVDEDGFDARHLPGGDLLIKVGPRVYGSEFGSGQCGACPRTELRIFRLGADMKPQEVLKLGGIVDNGSGASQDFSLSRDWSLVMQFDEDAMDDQGKPGPWSSTTWCRAELAYAQCDHRDQAAPPDPPVLKELRNAD
jgi:hypothetical protein